MSVATYFSHSYRKDDQGLNKDVWSYFSSDFAFFVDPPSDVTIHTHLEQMMRRCSAFVAVFNRRNGVPKPFCSPFVLYEYGLAVQARRPKLLVIDRKISRTPFEKLDQNETVYFSAGELDARADELKDKVGRLHDVAKAYPDALNRPRGKIAVVVPRDASDCAYARRKVLERITEAAAEHGFEIGVVKLPFTHNADLALELDEYEAVILDVRGTDLPDWVFPYAHGRLVPTIKLVRLEAKEVPGGFALPPIVEGLRMDSEEPAVESILYWRTEEDLVWQLERAFLKMDEGEIAFKKGAEAEYYFGTIARRPANIFISNASRENPLARRLSRELRLRNIKQFHYKDRNAIPAGSNWQKKIRSEVEACDVFVAIIGKGYETSEWSREEMRIARARDSQIILLPYAVEKTDLRFLGEHDLAERQVAPLTSNEDEDIGLIIENIESALTQVGRGQNHRVLRTKVLGGTREVLIDTIRHVPKSSWTTFLTRLSDDGIVVRKTEREKGPLRSRAAAEHLFDDAVRADTDPENKSTMATLATALTKAAPASHRRLAAAAAERIAKGASDAAD